MNRIYPRTPLFRCLCLLLGLLALPAHGSAVTSPAAGATPVTAEAAAQPTASAVAAAPSEVFGANLFNGSFTAPGSGAFNPDYVVASGDKIHVMLWGAFSFDAQLLVDSQGNILLPHAGPVTVRGVRNADLQRVVAGALARAFRNNVNSYVSLAAAQPVRVYVGGNVVRPGLYAGTSMDSVLRFLDLAGGIDPERGSYLAVEVRRGQTVRARVNLYDFLLGGVMPQVQLADGDLIFVAARQQTVRVSQVDGSVRRYEFTGATLSLPQLLQMARPDASATHVRILRNTGALRRTDYIALADVAGHTLVNGDEVAFTADKRPGTISVRVEGEHTGQQEYVLPYGTRLSELMARIEMTGRADRNSLQLFRQSVRERQKQMLHTALRGLETAALTARSGTSDEAVLRREEAQLLLQWVDRARKVEPTGQVVVSSARSLDDFYLESGDVIRIPARDALVLVGGEVLFPNAIAWDPGMSVDDYIRRAGGFTQNANPQRIVIAHRDGSYSDVSADSGWFADGAVNTRLAAGDEILVLPRIDVKSRQIWKDMTQIIYQIAVSAKVVLGL